MNKFELKWWHPIAGLALAELFKITTDNLGNPNFQTLFVDIYNWLEGIFGVLFIYVIIRNIYRSVTEPTIHWEGYEYDKPYLRPSPPPPNKMQEIEQELDEIEASLDAVTNSEKVTPIWEIPPKKP